MKLPSQLNIQVIATRLSPLLRSPAAAAESAVAAAAGPEVAAAAGPEVENHLPNLSFEH